MSDLGRELAAGLDAVLADVLPIETLLAAAADDEPTDIRADLGALGLFSLALDESAGGFGLGPGDLAEVGVVAGARLLPVWAREATILQAPALAGLSESRAAVQALDTLVGGSGGAGGRLVPTGDGSAGVGEVWLVGDPTLVPIIGPEGGVITDLGDATLEMSAAVEPGQGLHTGTVPGGAPGDLHLDPGHAAQLWAGWHLFVTAEMVGAADATLALSIEHATVREQFGRPLVRFQAVGHMLADMKADVELGRAGVARLAALLENAPDTDAAAGLLCAIARRARHAIEGAIQVHGGMGFTWERGLHLYYRRVLQVEATLGGRSAMDRRVGLAYLSQSG